MNRMSDLAGPKIELLHAITADVRKGFWSCCDRKERNSLGCCTSSHTSNQICDRCGLGMRLVREGEGARSRGVVELERRSEREKRGEEEEGEVGGR